LLTVVSLAPLGGDGDDPGDHIDPAHLDGSGVEVFLLESPIVVLGVGDDDPEDHIDPAHFEVSIVEVFLLAALSFAALGGGDVDPGDHIDPAQLEEEAVLLVLSPLVLTLGGDDDPADHIDPAHFEESAVAFLFALSLEPIGDGDDDDDPGDHIDPAHLEESGVAVFLLASLVALLCGGDPGDHIEPDHACVARSLLPRTSFPTTLVPLDGSMVGDGLKSFVVGGFVVDVDEPDPGDHTDPAHCVGAVSAFVIVSGALRFVSAALGDPVAPVHRGVDSWPTAEPLVLSVPKVGGCRLSQLIFFSTRVGC
jgi:hypothetical protein